MCFFSKRQLKYSAAHILIFVCSLTCGIGAVFPEKTKYKNYVIESFTTEWKCMAVSYTIENSNSDKNVQSTLIIINLNGLITSRILWKKMFIWQSSDRN